MPEFLGGRISKLAARLGVPGSGSVASKVDTLHDTYLTEPRATKLDTVLAETLWTSLKASYLDGALSSISDRPPTTSGLKGPATAHADVLTVEGVSVTHAGELFSASVATFDTWETLIEVTGGPGAIEFCSVFQLGNFSNRDARVELLIDGLVVWASDADFWQLTTDANKGACLVGAADPTQDYVAFGRVPFGTSFQVRFKVTESGGGTVEAGARVRWYGGELAAAAGSAFEDAVMALSPVAAYLFRDADFTTQIEDSSGNDYHMAKQLNTASRGAALRSTHPGGLAVPTITNWASHGIHYRNAIGGLDAVLGGAASVSIVLGVQLDSKASSNDFLIFSMGTEGASDYMLAVNMEPTGTTDIWFFARNNVPNTLFANDATAAFGEPAIYTYRFYNDGVSRVLLDRAIAASDTQIATGSIAGATLQDGDRTTFIGGRNNTGTGAYGAPGVIDHLSIFVPALSEAQLDSLRAAYQAEIA